MEDAQVLSFTKLTGDRSGKRTKKYSKLKGWSLTPLRWAVETDNPALCGCSSVGYANIKRISQILNLDSEKKVFINEEKAHKFQLLLTGRHAANMICFHFEISLQQFRAHL